MTIGGVPLHPLVVHAAVVLTPVAALAVAANALVPRWRWLLRHAALLLALGAAGAVQAAAMTGDTLARAFPPGNTLIADHEMWAGRLQAATWVMAGIAVVAWWALGVVSPFPTGNRVSRVRILDKALVVVLPVVALAVLVLVVLTGHAGAQAVWQGTPAS
jgi:hypothetical protein